MIRSVSSLSGASATVPLRKQILLGAAATIIVQSAEQLAVRAVRHPLLVFGLGVLMGGVVYRNRKSLQKMAGKGVDAGSKYALAQKEKMLDLIAEVKADQ